MSEPVTDQMLARKLAVLDKRDKSLRELMPKTINMDRVYVGSCEDMCPERERCLRLGFHLSIFERDERNQPDEYAMVKEYRRAGADQEEPLPHDLRTPKALETTMDYLICNIMDDPRSKNPEIAIEWYDFLWDRLRAIRKDITQQKLCDLLSVTLVERCARFHVHSCYAMNRVKDFDTNMNKKNLNDCLQMLRQQYSDLKTSGISCPLEVEFLKYDILLHLDEDHSSTNVLMKCSDHRSSKEMKFITRVFNAYVHNDYYKFFKLMKNSDYMTSCILSLYVNNLRLSGLKMIVAACNSRQTVWYPADLIIDAFEFDDLEDLREFASTMDVEIQERDSKHYLLFYKDLLNVIRQSGDSLIPIRSIKLVESKMNNGLVGQLVYGSHELPNNPYKISELHSTWNEPKPETIWFEEEQPMNEYDLSRGDLEMDDLQDEEPDMTDQSIKINHIQEDDVGLYHEMEEDTETDVDPEPEPEPVNIGFELPVHEARIETSVKIQPEDSLEPVPMDFEDERPRKTSTPKRPPEIVQVANLVAPKIPEPPKEIVPVVSSVPESEVTVEETKEEDPIPAVTPSISPTESSNDAVDTKDRYTHIRDTMPAGRFKKMTIRKKTPHLKPSYHVAAARAIKKVKLSQQLALISESLQDEMVANRNLHELIKILSNR